MKNVQTDIYIIQHFESNLAHGKGSSDILAITFQKKVDR